MARVLLVDDDTSTMYVMREFLRGAGYEVETAEDARSALRLLRSASFDVVVADVILPGMTGVALLRSIRQEAPLVQVIMMTGDPSVETVSEALRERAYDYLMKPVSKDAIVHAVGNAVKAKMLDDERARLDVAKREYQENLELLVAERTRALQQAVDELKKTRNLVIQQERMSALSQMASGIAHDFNNVLMPILGYSELLQDPKTVADDKERLEVLQIINSAAKDGANIVKRLREFYKSDEDLEPEPVQIRKLVEDAIRLTEPKWKQQAMARNVEIHFRTDLEPLPDVECNMTSMRQVFINLILNAVDAMPGGGAVSFIGRAEGEEVVIGVTDVGTGMTPDVMHRCFEPFFTTRGQRGLGLSTVYGIVQRHGGTVTVHSEFGKGTTFVLRLPVRSAAARKEEADSVFSPVDPLHILVADDEEMTLKLLAKMLASDGHKVETAENGREALALFSAGKFDMIILDRAMPQGNGDELAAKIRKESPQVRVILLTGFGEVMKEKGECPPGVDMVLSKPVSAAGLHRAIARVWTKQKSTA